MNGISLFFRPSIFVVLFFLGLSLCMDVTSVVCKESSETNSGSISISQANTIRVNTLEDYRELRAIYVSLRAALTIAHTGGTIPEQGTIDPNAKVTIDLTGLQGQTIVLTDPEPLPAIDKDIEIYGWAENPSVINGNKTHRIFFVRKGKLSLKNLHLKQGRGKGGNAGTGNLPGGGGGGMGGAIFVNKDTETDCQNVHFIENFTVGGTGGSFAPISGSAGATSSGGGFYGDALPGSGIGGSGGYLEDEGKGGGRVWGGNNGENGGFGGGGSGGDPVSGNGGYGGGGGAKTGIGGAFGGNAGYVYIPYPFSVYEYCGGGGAGLGGAIFVRTNGKLSLDNCHFQSNSAFAGAGGKWAHNGQGKGGAIFIQDSNYSPFMNDVYFSSNAAANSGNYFTISNDVQDTHDFYGKALFKAPIIQSIVPDEQTKFHPTTKSFIVTFDRDVVGVDVTDFNFDTDTQNDTTIDSVERIDDKTYKVNVTISRNVGYITLKLVDDDSIRKKQEQDDGDRIFYLGFKGQGNGNFTGERFEFAPLYSLSSILPLTGVYTDYGIQIKNGVELAVNNINLKPYDNRHIIELKNIDDTSSDSSLNAIVTEEKNADSALGFLGSAVSHTTQQLTETISTLCGDNPFTLFSPTASSTILNNVDYLVSMVPFDHYEVEAMHQAIKKNFNSTIFLITEESEYGRDFLTLQSKEGIVLQGQYTYQPNSFDLTQALQDITSAFSNENPTIVIATYETEANQILKTLATSDNANLRNATIFLSDAALATDTFTGLPEKSSNYQPTIVGLTPVIPDLQSTNAFTSQYQSTYGSAPEWFSYYGYDAALAFHHALKNATDVTRAGMWEATHWLSFEGVTGTKRFDNHGNLISAAYDLIQVDNGNWQRVETIRVLKPEESSSSTNAGIVSGSNRLFAAPNSFTYTLNAADPSISHYAGEADAETCWVAESLNATIGGVLMAYYEDIERGVSTSGEPFVFEDGQTYYLTFNLYRVDLSDESPGEGDALEIAAQSVYHYLNEDGITHFARTDLIAETVGVGWARSVGYKEILGY
jgi:ABC-type branched-subunit amino acid transport system substrate-binding protein